MDMKLYNIYKEMKLEERENYLAKEWLNKQEYIDCWIDGKFQKPVDGNYISLNIDLEQSYSINVLEGKNFAEIAVRSSTQAQAKWRKEKRLQRSEILYKISKELQLKRELFMQMNFHNFRNNDFQLFVDYFNFYSDFSYDDYENWNPSGIVLIILSRKSSPWFLAMNVAAALAAGCSVIVKPSTKNPFFSFLMAQVCSEAGLPEGMLNIVPGSKITSQELLSYDVNRIVFNGSHLVAAQLQSMAPDKHFSFFEPNRTSSIILETCDLQGTIDKLFTETWNHNYYNTWGVSLIVVQESIYPIFNKKIRNKMESWNQRSEIPDGFKNRIKREKVKELISRAKTSGLEVIGGFDDDDICSPSLIIEYQDEISDFKIPIASLKIARTAEEAVQLVNSSSYCLGTSVWTENLSQAMELATELESNTVWINCHGVIDVHVPFEPSRNVGVGCFGGILGLLHYMDMKEPDCKEIQERSNLSEDRDTNAMTDNLIFLNKMVSSSRISFNMWKSCKNRKSHLKDISRALLQDEQLSEYSSIVDYWILGVNSYEVVMDNGRRDLYAAQNTAPIGIIAIILTETKDVIKSFLSLVTPAIAMGNVTIVVVTENVKVELKPVIDLFDKCLPNHVLNLATEIDFACELVSNPYVEAFWVHSTSSITSTQQMRKLKKCQSKYFKRFWVTPSDLSQCRALFRKNCLQRQAIWFTKINHFP